MSEAVYTLEQVIDIRNENYKAGRSDERERIIKLLDAQEVEGWFDRGLKQHFIALIKGERQKDHETVSLLTGGEPDGMAYTDLTKPIRLTAIEWEQLNEALEGENK